MYENEKEDHIIIYNSSDINVRNCYESCPESDVFRGGDNFLSTFADFFQCVLLCRF